jgi:nucleotide-binding universal stress UspA family protein
LLQAMFKHILIPTDGSGVAAKAIRAGVELAKEMGARVTGFYAVEPRPVHLDSAGYGVEKALLKEFDRRSHEFAERCVGEIESAAKAAGVPFDRMVVKSVRPDQAIIEAAKTRKCDAIFMASHGHRGLVGLVLGSVTNKVLAHSKIPVLVFR